MIVSFQADPLRMGWPTPLHRWGWRVRNHNQFPQLSLAQLGQSNATGVGHSTKVWFHKNVFGLPIQGIKLWIWTKVADPLLTGQFRPGVWLVYGGFLPSSWFHLTQQTLQHFWQQLKWKFQSILQMIWQSKRRSNMAHTIQDQPTHFSRSWLFRLNAYPLFDGRNQRIVWNSFHYSLIRPIFKMI